MSWQSQFREVIPHNFITNVIFLAFNGLRLIFKACLLSGPPLAPASPSLTAAWNWPRGSRWAAAVSPAVLWEVGEPARQAACCWKRIMSGLLLEKLNSYQAAPAPKKLPNAARGSDILWDLYSPWWVKVVFFFLSCLRWWWLIARLMHFTFHQSYSQNIFPPLWLTPFPSLLN